MAMIFTAVNVLNILRPFLLYRTMILIVVRFKRKEFTKIAHTDLYRYIHHNSSIALGLSRR